MLFEHYGFINPLIHTTDITETDNINDDLFFDRRTTSEYANSFAPRFLFLGKTRQRSETFHKLFPCRLENGHRWYFKKFIYANARNLYKKENKKNNKKYDTRTIEYCTSQRIPNRIDNVNVRNVVNTKIYYYFYTRIEI